MWLNLGHVKEMGEKCLNSSIIILASGRMRKGYYSFESQKEKRNPRNELVKSNLI